MGLRAIEKNRKPKLQRIAPQKVKSLPIPQTATQKTKPTPPKPPQQAEPKGKDFAPRKPIAPQ